MTRFIYRQDNKFILKKILRHFSVEALALFVVTQVFSGMVFEKGLQTFVIASAAITAATIFGKPVINVLLLPLNLITFGLFRWVSSAVALYIVTLLVSGFNIAGFYFQGYSSKWIDVPEIQLEGILAYIAFSFALSILTSFIHWLRK